MLELATPCRSPACRCAPGSALALEMDQSVVAPQARILFSASGGKNVRSNSGCCTSRRAWRCGRLERAFAGPTRATGGAFAAVYRRFPRIRTRKASAHRRGRSHGAAATRSTGCAVASTGNGSGRYGRHDASDAHAHAAVGFSRTTAERIAFFAAVWNDLRGGHNHPDGCARPPFLQVDPIPRKVLPE